MLLFVLAETAPTFTVSQANLEYILAIGAVVSMLVGFGTALVKVLDRRITASNDALLAKLNAPNGGKSLYDISAKLTQVVVTQEVAAEKFDHVEKRHEELRHRVESIIEPRQHDIAQDIKTLLDRLER